MALWVKLLEGGTVISPLTPAGACGAVRASGYMALG